MPNKGNSNWKKVDLGKIKKAYGEEFAQWCERPFAAILNNPGELYNILEQSFGVNCGRFLWRDIKKNDLQGKFQQYIFSRSTLKDSLFKKPVEEVTETPYELLKKKGYTLVECTTEAEVQSMKKYYAPGEELCTFHGRRLDESVVFFAIREDAKQLDRDSFKKPQREDPYGTSVLSIQFLRLFPHTLNIITRYNYAVDNPGGTYSNDLDEIIPGLSASFKKLLTERGFQFPTNDQEEFEIPGYEKANDGKLYKINLNYMAGRFAGPGNIILRNGNVKQLPNHQILIDAYILDRKANTISFCDEMMGKDGFMDALGEIQGTSIVDNPESKDGRRIITIKRKGQSQPAVITINAENEIVGYRDEGITEIQDYFMKYNLVLEELYTPNVISVGDECLPRNYTLREVYWPKVESIGQRLLKGDGELEIFEAPLVKKMGNECLCAIRKMKRLNLPSLEYLGYSFGMMNNSLEELRAPKLKGPVERFLVSHKKPFSVLEVPDETGIKEKFEIIPAKPVQPEDIARLARGEAISNSEIGSAGKQS